MDGQTLFFFLKTEKAKNVLKLPKTLMLLYNVSNQNFDKNKWKRKLMTMLSI